MAKGLLLEVRTDGMGKPTFYDPLGRPVGGPNSPEGKKNASGATPYSKRSPRRRRR